MTGIDQYLTRRFRPAVVALVAFYVALQFVYIAHLPMVMDEFDGAYEAYRLRHAVPYRDFAPYKTVLGYYIETPWTFLSSTVWGRIVAVKSEIALINAAMLATAALYMSRFLRKPAILAALLLLVLCSTFLERSSELRVDMLTGWAGLWSLLFLMRGRYGWAGAAAGLSFLISQKGAFYLLAGAAAAGVHWLFTEPVPSGTRRVLRYIASATAVVVAYVVLWGAASSLRSVLDATFIGGVNAALLPSYEIRHRFWTQILRRDPAYFLLSAFALWRIASARSISLFVYAGAVLLQVALYPQPWPYFFVLIFPTLFVLHAAFFDVAGLRTPLLVILLVFAVLYPMRRILVVLARHNDYQRYNVELASAMLAPNDTYLAGTDIIHDHEQSLPILSRLGGTVIAALRAQPAALPQQIAAALDRRPPKLIIGNYRIYGLPPPLLDYILRHYARLSASVFSYAPLTESGAVRLAFAGRYLIDAKSPGPVAIDGTTYRSGSRVQLTAGMHRLAAGSPVRLRLVAEGIESVLDPRFVDEQDFYPHVYDY